VTLEIRVGDTSTEELSFLYR